MSLLSTPTASVAKGGTPQDSQGKRDLRLDLPLLPTPNAADGTGGPGHQGRDGGLNLRTAASLLPTPTARDWKDGGPVDAVDTNGLLGRAVWDLAPDPALLPTPRATDGTKGGPNQRGSSGDMMLPSAVQTLLPTPSAALASGGQTSRSGDRADEMLLSGLAEAATDGRLLPTPTAQLQHDSQTHRSGARTDELLLGGIALAAADGRLLPTPVAGDAKAARNLTSGRQPDSAHHTGTTLTDAVEHLEWGPFAPAVARWERVLDRPAPPPTEPGAKGQPRLSPAFVEWMMGLPPGHVTAVPRIGRNGALKALGNGVVPQQAAVALRLLLTGARP